MTDRSGRTFEEYRDLYWAEKKRRKELETGKAFEKAKVAELKLYIAELEAELKQLRLLVYAGEEE